MYLNISSVQFSHSVMSNSLQPHEPQHARHPCPSPTPRVHPNPCPLSQWCHPTISSYVIPFSSWPQSFPALGSFQMSQLFASGSQSIGISASTSVLPMNTQDWYPLGWLREAEDIKKRWQEYTKELYKKDLHDPDNHDGVITHLEPDILECEVKWALGRITTNKASGGDGIPVDLFQIRKNDAVKVLHSICQQIWKTQQWPQD